MAVGTIYRVRMEGHYRNQNTVQTLFIRAKEWTPAEDDVTDLSPVAEYVWTNMIADIVENLITDEYNAELVTIRPTTRKPLEIPGWFLPTTSGGIITAGVHANCTVYIVQRTASENAREVGGMHFSGGPEQSWDSVHENWTAAYLDEWADECVNFHTDFPVADIGTFEHVLNTAVAPHPVVVNAKPSFNAGHLRSRTTRNRSLG